MSRSGYYEGREEEYDRTHVLWEVNRIADERSLAKLRGAVEGGGGESKGDVRLALEVACGTGKSLGPLAGLARGVVGLDLEEGAHTIAPLEVEAQCSRAGLRTLSLHTYDFFPRVYTRAPAYARVYAWLLHLEERHRSRWLPLHGTVLRYFGCKQGGGSGSAGTEELSTP